MKAAVLTGKRKIEIQDIESPTCGPGQVIVRPEFTGICGTDQHVFNGEFEGRVAYPAVLGHEFGGRVVKTGADITGFREGDRVVVDPIIPCRRCTACHEGHFNACRSLKLRGIDLPGGMAEEVVCDEWQLFCYPEPLAMEHSSMAELYSIGCHCAVQARLAPGDTVAVFGAGKVGLSVIDVFKQLGVHTLFAVDVVGGRLAKAEELGADICINPLEENPVERILDITEGKGVDRAVESVGHYDEISGIEPPVSACGSVLRSGGRMVVLGQGPQKTPLFLKSLVWKEIEIIMSRVSRGEFPRAVRLLEGGKLHPAVIITGIYPLEQAGEIFEMLEKNREDHIKAVLKI